MAQLQRNTRQTPPSSGQGQNFAHPTEDGAEATTYVSQVTERLGDLLRRERERRGDQLEYIAEYLRIRPSFLRALENSRYEEFPADAYVIGFLRSYAEFLGLNGKDAIDYYRHEMAGRRRKPTLAMPTPLSEGRSPTVPIMIAAVIAVLLIYIIWYSNSGSDRATVSVPQPVPPQVSTETPHGASTTAASAYTPMASSTSLGVSETQSGKATASTENATAANPPPHLLIKASQASWVLIADSKGTPLFDKVMKAGETYKVPDNIAGPTLTTGNGAGIVIVVDGVDMPKLSSAASKIIRNVPLDADSLKNRTAE